MPNRAELRIGGTRLAVADLERSRAFYCGLLGLLFLNESDDLPSLCGHPDRVTFCAFHEELAPQASQSNPGFYRFALMFRHRRELARVVKCLVDTAYGIEGASHSGNTEAVYLKDPDGILIELCVEGAPRLPKPLGVRELDLEGLLKELS